MTRTAYKNLTEAQREFIPGGERTAQHGFVLNAEWWADNRDVASTSWSKWMLANR